MANSVFSIIVTTQDSAQAVKDKFILSRQSPATLLDAIARYFERMASGNVAAKAYVSTTVVQASGTITLASFVAADTVTINGTLLTGSDTPSGSAQFSTAGGDDTVIAANLAACVNANTTLNKQVVATSAAKVVTITALVSGAFGNLGTLAISAHGSVSGGGLLASGAQDVPTLISHGI